MKGRISYNGLRDVVLWFGTFGMKILDFLSVAILWELWRMTSSVFCCVAMPL